MDEEFVRCERLFTNTTMTTISSTINKKHIKNIYRKNQNAKNKELFLINNSY